MAPGQPFLLPIAPTDGWPEQLHCTLSRTRRRSRPSHFDLPDVKRAARIRCLSVSNVRRPQPHA
jgi:hypothetical protein